MAKESVLVPVAILAFDRLQRAVIIVASFRTTEIPGGCPAPWCFESMAGVWSHVLCHEATIEISIEDERLWVPGEATKSGHLLVPIDNWGERTLSSANQPRHVFHSSEQLLAEYHEDAYHGLENQVVESSATRYRSLVGILAERSS